jgi:hypothetical protein
MDPDPFAALRLPTGNIRLASEMLVNTHVVGSPAPQNPVLHLHRTADGRLFEHYLKSFDRVWDAGRPLEADVPA